MISFVAQITKIDNSLLIYVHDKQIESYVNRLIERIKKTNSFARVTLDKPFVKRTTGEKSQSHHINGHIQQICSETGNDFDSVKMACKFEAIAEGYPFDTIRGKVIPWSETRISVEQATILIETIHRIAAELGIILIEEEV